MSRATPSLTLFDLVMKLVGPINPIGEHDEDARRLRNLKALTDLTDRLLYSIGDAAVSANREEASMRAISQHAARFIKEVKES